MGKKRKFEYKLDYTTILCWVFIALKTTNVIHWSWWWVMAPVWIPIAFVLFVFMTALAMQFLFDCSISPKTLDQMVQPLFHHINLSRISKRKWQWIGGFAFCALLGIAAYFV